MIRFHFTYNKDNMARWLDKMDREGWALKRFGAGFCSFEPVTPGTYDYQIDYAGGSPDPGYRSLMAELGIDVVCRWGPWVVLRRAATDGPFELYTDVDSRLDQLSHVKRFFKIMACVELLCVMWVLAAAVEERNVYFLIIAGLGLAAAIGMIIRVREVTAEMTSLGAPESGLAQDRTSRVLFGAGALIMLAGLLLAESPFGYLSHLLMGAGFALQLCCLVRLCLLRRA